MLGVEKKAKAEPRIIKPAMMNQRLVVLSKKMKKIRPMTVNPIRLKLQSWVRFCRKACRQMGQRWPASGGGSRQDQASGFRCETFYILEVKAQEEGYGKCSAETY